MRSAAVAITLAILFLTSAFARAEAPPTAAAKPPEAVHYRALGKMLRRFAAQAGSTSSGKVYASR
ncbi:MAG: hypothetical protein JWN44_4125 [Myxococcales bacterium]|nr:hypothetical protein [Myxococcales bacterium]